MRSLQRGRGLHRGDGLEADLKAAKAELRFNGAAVFTAEMVWYPDTYACKVPCFNGAAVFTAEMAPGR